MEEGCSRLSGDTTNSPTVPLLVVTNLVVMQVGSMLLEALPVQSGRDHVVIAGDRVARVRCSRISRGDHVVHDEEFHSWPAVVGEPADLVHVVEVPIPVGHQLVEVGQVPDSISLDDIEDVAGGLELGEGRLVLPNDVLPLLVGSLAQDKPGPIDGILDGDIQHAKSRVVFFKLSFTFGIQTILAWNILETNKSSGISRI